MEDIEPYDYDGLEQQAQPLKGNHLKGCGSLYVRKSDQPSNIWSSRPSCGYRRLKYKNPTHYQVKNHHPRVTRQDLRNGHQFHYIMNVIHRIEAKHHTRARNHNRSLKPL